jgi:hypothetical protein
LASEQLNPESQKTFENANPPSLDHLGENGYLGSGDAEAAHWRAGIWSVLPATSASGFGPIVLRFA